MMHTDQVMPAPTASERILLVDDEPDLRQLVTFNLRDAGFDVDAVGSGQAGLALAAKIRPAVIVLDLMLPDLSGTEVCRLMRADAVLADVAVLMLTARSDEYDRCSRLRSGRRRLRGQAVQRPRTRRGASGPSPAVRPNGAPRGRPPERTASCAGAASKSIQCATGCFSMARSSSCGPSSSS